MSYARCSLLVVVKLATATANNVCRRRVTCNVHLNARFPAWLQQTHVIGTCQRSTLSHILLPQLHVLGILALKPGWNLDWSFSFHICLLEKNWTKLTWQKFRYGTEQSYIAWTRLLHTGSFECQLYNLQLLFETWKLFTPCRMCNWFYRIVSSCSSKQWKCTFAHAHAHPLYSTYRGLWGLLVVWLLWLSGWALAAQTTSHLWQYISIRTLLYCIYALTSS